jgi:hypothetical protein
MAVSSFLELPRVPSPVCSPHAHRKINVFFQFTNAILDKIRFLMGVENNGMG